MSEAALPSPRLQLLLPTRLCVDLGGVGLTSPPSITQLSVTSAWIQQFKAGSQAPWASLLQQQLPWLQKEGSEGPNKTLTEWQKQGT